MYTDSFPLSSFGSDFGKNEYMYMFFWYFFNSWISQQFKAILGGNKWC